jgi:hypothetical protein
VIFTGDFNSTEGEVNPIEYIKNGSPLKMRDTYRDVYPTGSVTTGFGVRFDYIFIENLSTNSTVSTYVVNSPVASDHLPIVATVKMGTSTNIPLGQTIWLQNSGKYVSSNNGGAPVTCDRPTVQGWEKFDVVDAGNGKVALKGTNGLYLSSENGLAAMNCNRISYSDWEKFEWVKLGSSQVALKGNNGKFVSSENGATTGMNCNRPSYSGWEVFNWGTTLKSASLSPSTENLPVTNNLYPNPFTNELYLNNSGEATSITIYDLSGKLITSQDLSSGTNSIDITSLEKGIYIAKINNVDNVQILKILKK